MNSSLLLRWNTACAYSTLRLIRLFELISLLIFNCVTPKSNEILEWIHQFPKHAGRNKSLRKKGEGTSFGDLSIIQEYEKCRKKSVMSEVFIWSLDSDLSQYFHKPTLSNVKSRKA